MAPASRGSSQQSGTRLSTICRKPEKSEMTNLAVTQVLIPTQNFVGSNLAKYAYNTADRKTRGGKLYEQACGGNYSCSSSIHRGRTLCPSRDPGCCRGRGRFPRFNDARPGRNGRSDGHGWGSAVRLFLRRGRDWCAARLGALELEELGAHHFH